MSDVAFAEALSEFSVWDRARAAKHITRGSFSQTPRERAGKIVKVVRKKRGKPRAALVGRIAPVDDLKKCVNCPAVLYKRTSHRECSACRIARWKRKHPNARCIDCGKPPRPETPRCRSCAIKHVGRTKPPCSCGRPHFCKGLCEPCYHKGILAKPYSRAKAKASGRVRSKRHYYKDIEKSRAMNRERARKHYHRKKAAHADHANT